MIKDVSFLTIANFRLMPKQIPVLCVFFRCDIKVDQRVFMYGNHIVKPEKTVFPILKFENMLA